MFLAHLLFFLSTIGFVLFVVRSLNQSGSERFLTLFAFLFFLETAAWLLYFFYGFSLYPNYDVDSLFNDNTALLIPLVAVYLFGKEVRRVNFLYYLIFILLVSGLFTYTQYLISSDPFGDILSFSNKNLNYNLGLQLLYVIIIFSAFLFFLKRIKTNPDSELFDKTYKIFFILLFITYYSVDILGLVVFFVGKFHRQLVSSGLLVFINSLLNLLMVLLIVVLAIYTNWLSLFNRLKSKLNKEESEIAQTSDFDLDLRTINLEIKNWKNFKKAISTDYQYLVDEIEELEFLTNNEKMYATFIPFELPQKDISDFLCVSLRTVETNFYRLRTKLKENNHSIVYPFGFITKEE
jgi:hypothetical protein